MDQDFSPETFSTSQPKKRSSGTSALVIVLGLFFGGIVLCCCCCLVLGFVVLRQPIGVVTMWGSFISVESYDSADLVLCEGSQAARYTDQLQQQGATFSSFSAEQDLGDDVIATATLNVGGQSNIWQATFTTASGGTFGKCIDTITVTSE